MLLYGMQLYWNMWLSMTQTAPSTPLGILLLTGGMGLHCSMAAPTEMSFHKGKAIKWSKFKKGGNLDFKNILSYTVRCITFFFLLQKSLYENSSNQWLSYKKCLV